MPAKALIIYYPGINFEIIPQREKVQVEVTATKSKVATEN